MNIFKICADKDNYMPLVLDIPNDWQAIIFHKPGELFGSNWVAPQATLRKIDGRKTKIKVKQQLIADCPPFGSLDVAYTRRAVDMLGENYLRQYGELLPFKSKDGVEYFWFNFTNTINAFDDKNAIFERRNPNGTIGGIERYAFFAEKIGDNEMFLDFVTRKEFVTDRFKARVEAAGLTGMLFKQIWSDEAEKPAKIHAEMR
jgi:hypothetical protein